MAETQVPPDRYTRRDVLEMQTANTAGRSNAYTALQMAIGRLRGKADELEALAGALPREMSHAADEALWNMVERIGR